MTYHDNQKHKYLHFTKKRDSGTVICGAEQFHYVYTVNGHWKKEYESLPGLCPACREVLNPKKDEAEAAPTGEPK